MKRLFAVLLVLALVFSLAPMVMAAPDDGILTENDSFEEEKEITPASIEKHHPYGASVKEK